jgi:hypothetical protein
MKLSVGRLEWDPTLARLIGVVRLAFAAFALFIVWVDPTQPSKHVAIAYTAFIVYLVYSAAAFQVGEVEAVSGGLQGVPPAEQRV